jgi:DNA-binding XRE family transcriptional regulator
MMYRALYMPQPATNPASTIASAHRAAPPITTAIAALPREPTFAPDDRRRSLTFCCFKAVGL